LESYPRTTFTFGSSKRDTDQKVVGTIINITGQHIDIAEEQRTLEAYEHGKTISNYYSVLSAISTSIGGLTGVFITPSNKPVLSPLIIGLIIGSSAWFIASRFISSYLFSKQEKL
jgi:hypothetical protein